MPGRQPSVLVVDDHLDTCKMMVRLLRHMRCDAVCRESGRAALDYLTGATPDLMVVDVMMPDLNGLDVLAAVRARPATRAVPVIMYSAVTDDATAERAAALGAQAFVVKGRMAFGELRGVVERHVRCPDA
ncbi:MAG TPA: response regulator [Tepidisphaeraceae bacterium]|nr:response regulator [Tepidisphaeraceae bacterium]